MQHPRWRAAVVLAAVAGAAVLSATRPARLGLDLRGGTQIVLEAEDTDTVKADGDTVDRTFEVLRRRVDQLGGRPAAGSGPTPRRCDRLGGGRHAGADVGARDNPNPSP